MKSTSQGTVRWRIRSAMKKTAPLRTPTSSRSRAARSRRRSPRRARRRARAASPRRPAPRRRRARAQPCSSRSRARTPGVSTRPGTATTSSPRTTSGHASRSRPGHLGVDEHVLQLLAPPGEPIARPPGRTSRPGSVATRSSTAPQRTGPCSRLSSSYSRTARIPPPRSACLRAVARSRAARGACARASRGRRAARRPREREHVLARPRDASSAQQRQDLVADQAPLRVRVRAVARGTASPSRGAVGLGLLAPEREQRADDAVLAPRLDARAARRSRRGGRGRSRPGRRRCGRSRAAGPSRQRVPERRAAPPRCAPGGAVDDLRAEALAAEARVLVRLGAAEPVVHVQRRDAVAERAGAACQRQVESAPPETRQVTVAAALGSGRAGGCPRSTRARGAGIGRRSSGPIVGKPSRLGSRSGGPGGPRS